MADLPKVSTIPSSSDSREQLKELRTYLVRLVDEIEVALDAIEQKIEARKESI